MAGCGPSFWVQIGQYKSWLGKANFIDRKMNKLMNMLLQGPPGKTYFWAVTKG